MATKIGSFLLHGSVTPWLFLVKTINKSLSTSSFALVIGSTDLVYLLTDRTNVFSFFVVLRANLHNILKPKSGSCRRVRKPHDQAMAPSRVAGSFLIIATNHGLND